MTFTFTITRQSNGDSLEVPVVGGSCGAPVPTFTGRYDITENLDSNLWNVADIRVVPKSQSVKLTEDITQGFITVKVAAGAETQVHYQNFQAGATLKVCKWSTAPSIQGSSFTFAVSNGASLSAIAGTSVATAGCSGTTPVAPGANLTITEALPANIKVQGVTTGGTTTITSVTANVVKAKMGTGANILYFQNEPVPPPQTGYIEVCKVAGDTFTSGNFTFTITATAMAPITEVVAVGQCSGPIVVSSGNVLVAETAVANSALTGVITNPADRLGPVNLPNGTATVVVPVSATTNNETQVFFKNEAVTSTLKICKVLAAGSLAALDGRTFLFDVTTASTGTGTPLVLTIVANTSPTGACKIVEGALPVGSSVKVVERAAPFVNGGPLGATSTQNVTLAAGVNTVTFTNAAFGTIEICKKMIDSDVAYNGNVFTFTISTVPGVTYSVRAGKCSPQITVPVGTAVVTEIVPANYSFVSSTATGPLGDNRATSGTSTNGGNPITVTVPFPGGSANETLVTFTNKVQRAFIKICKEITPGSTDSLDPLTYTFQYNAFVNGAFVFPAGSPPEMLIKPFPACTGILFGPNGIPVINANGTPTQVGVTELQNHPGLTIVDSIVVDNGTIITPPFTYGTTPVTVNPDKTKGDVIFNPKAGVDIVTYTNKEAPPTAGQVAA